MFVTDDFQPQKALLQTAKCLHFLVSLQNAFTLTNFKFLSFKHQPWAMGVSETVIFQFSLVFCALIQVKLH